MGSGTFALKSCLGIISIFFWACAVTLIVIGAIILGEYGNLTELAQSTDILVPSMLIIGAGVFLFIVGLLGCIGGMRGNKGALTVFFILTLIVLVGEVTAVAFGYEFRNNAGVNLTDRLHKMVKDCDSDDHKTDCDEVNFLQRGFKCCGADTYEDWYKWSSMNYSIPQSCCRQADCVTPPEGTNETVANEIIYTDGCSTKAVNLMKKYFTWIFIGTVVIVILQVLGMVATCIMLCRSRDTPYLSLDSQGYRV